MSRLSNALGALVTILSLALGSTAHAADISTGTVLGTVVSTTGDAISGAHIIALSPTGRGETTTDSKGTFTLIGLQPDTYAVSVDATNYIGSNTTVVVMPGEHERVTFTLQKSLKQIAQVRSHAQPFTVGNTSDTFTVTGAEAQASNPLASASGLSNYSRDTVQGAIANVPGVQQDSFANIIVRGGKVQDTVYDYDSIPIPQGLIAEPGGNIVGAQLGTTGVGSATVTLGGYSDDSQNALGGVVNEIPLTGTYPAQSSLELATGFGAQLSEAKFQDLWATPDLRWRTAFAVTVGQEYFSYGDGRSTYPAEIGTYGMGFQTRSQYGISGDVHYAASSKDDLSFVFLTGAAAYQQYDSPYKGLQWSTFGSPFPGQPENPNQQVNTPSIGRGTYGVDKLQWVHNWSHSLERFQVFQSQIGAIANGPEWDDLSFPDGVISLASTQAQNESGFGYDYEDQAGQKHDVRAGYQYDVNVSNIDQVVPTVPEYINANPRLNGYLAYLSDQWSITPHFSTMESLRYVGQHTVTSDGLIYGVNSIDPHFAAAYTFDGQNGLRASFDHNSVPPLPLEVQRNCYPASQCSDDSGANANGTVPSVALNPETSDDYAFSYEHGGRTQVRLTYFMEFDKNVIDVLPFNYRSNPGENPDAVGVPTNAGSLRSHGLEFFAKNGGFTLNANYNNTLTSSIYQFAFNDLNEPAILAGHLFPANYIPNFTATLSYEFDFLHKRLRIAPMLSYESGYPYGNGTQVWTVNAAGKPVLVPNDNYIDPGYNYYFLKNPADPYNAKTNPYIASLDDGEGADPNTLRTTPQTLVSLHAEGDLSPRVTVMLDIVNLLDTTTPTQLQGNPYLVGPPGYTGGNLTYEKALGQLYCSPPSPCPLYTLGNGIPTNNGQRAAAPWSYGTSGYVPEAYPLARTAMLRLKLRL